MKLEMPTGISLARFAVMGVWRVFGITALGFLLFSCGSSSAPAAPDSPDTTTPAASGPNLQIDANAVPSSIELTTENFSASDCEVQEGCVSGTGARKLLLFEGDIINAGNADLVLGNPATNPDFKWSPCHQHYHLQDIMLYELVRPSDGQVVTSGNAPVTARKQGFCMEDGEPALPNAGPAKFDCTHQGLSAGWEDVYNNQLPCQWLDVTGVAPGNYFLRLTVNPDGIYPDTQRNDNVALIPVTIQ